MRYVILVEAVHPGEVILAVTIGAGEPTLYAVRQGDRITLDDGELHVLGPGS